MSSREWGKFCTQTNVSTILDDFENSWSVVIFAVNSTWNLYFLPFPERCMLSFLAEALSQVECFEDKLKIDFGICLSAQFFWNSDGIATWWDRRSWDLYCQRQSTVCYLYLRVWITDVICANTLFFCIVTKISSKRSSALKIRKAVQ